MKHIMEKNHQLCCCGRYILCENLMINVLITILFNTLKFFIDLNQAFCCAVYWFTKVFRLIYIIISIISNFIINNTIHFIKGHITFLDVPVLLGWTLTLCASTNLFNPGRTI